jgi:hypothetical protein
MNERHATLVQVNTACLMQVIRFLKSEMTAAESIRFTHHARQCPDCRSFIDTISALLARKDAIRKQLEIGGFDGPTQDR